jgi:hypothetical protein
LKSKNEAFAERNLAKKRIKKQQEPVPEEMKEILETTSTYVNPNRLYSLESKIG